jgi:hypothetical protein
LKQTETQTREIPQQNHKSEHFEENGVGRASKLRRSLFVASTLSIPPSSAIFVAGTERNRTIPSFVRFWIICVDLRSFVVAFGFLSGFGIRTRVFRAIPGSNRRFSSRDGFKVIHGGRFKPKFACE